MAAQDPLHQPADPELGITTAEDSNWGTVTPSPVTRTLLATSIAYALLSHARILVCKLGLHRSRP